MMKSYFSSFLFLLFLLVVSPVVAFKPEQNPDNDDPIPNRPADADRSYKSEAIEKIIEEVSKVIKDERVKTTFKNCFPSTLDTTVLWHGQDSNLNKSFIITGDIPALWLRDSTYQINPYLPYMKDDPQLKALVLGLINMQADLLSIYPYANAYFAPEYTGIKNTPNEWSAKDSVLPKYDDKVVFEAKYELDSLASFLYLTKRYYEETQETVFLDNPKFRDALEKVVATMIDQQLGTVETMGQPKFSFTRPTTTHSETQNLYGIGNPVANCGLIRSFFRPSDDSTIFHYLIPSNAMAVIGLEGVATVLDKAAVLPDLSKTMKELAAKVRKAIQQWAVVKHPGTGKNVYAFEVDCYGSHVLMDDANFPSLLSLPRFGFVEKTDPVYLATREYILNSRWNPYYFDGKYPGIGSPHTGLGEVWHMALSAQGITATSEEEMAGLLNQLVSTTAGTGLMHESYNVDNPRKFSRPWFAWSNTVFADYILQLYEHHRQILENPTYPTSKPTSPPTDEPDESSTNQKLGMSAAIMMAIGKLFV